MPKTLRKFKEPIGSEMKRYLKTRLHLSMGVGTFLSLSVFLIVYLMEQASMGVAGYQSGKSRLIALLH